MAVKITVSPFPCAVTAGSRGRQQWDGGRQEWDGGTAPAPCCSNLSCALSLQVHQDTQAAELGRALLRAQRCSHCSSPATLGGTDPRGPLVLRIPSLLCLQCSELRSELEALSEEYRSCLRRLRQCRTELNRSQGSRAQRQRGPWIPLLVAVAAVAIATFLATYSL
ncbi:hypothetical protein Nmel_017761 [Mimus melanotis]